MLKNIIIVNDRAYIDGGAGYVAITSAIALAKRRYNVILFSAIGPIDSSLKESGVKVICLNQCGILEDRNRLRAIVQGIWNNKAYKELNKTLDKLNKDETIVHVHAYSKALSASIFAAVAKSGFKLVVTLHEFFTICPNGGLFNYRLNKICHVHPSSFRCYLCNCDSRNYFQKIWRSLRQVVLNKAIAMNYKIHMFTISDLTEKIFKEKESWISRSKIQLCFTRINNPVNLTNNKIVDISNNDIYVMIARISIEKGVDLFCEAITDLGLKGRVLGAGYLLEEYKKKYPKIEFVGWVSGKEKEKCLSDCKALILPSVWYETFGLVVAEMKSMGIPSIVPDKSAAAEQIIDNETGFIFNIGNVESLKKTIIKCENTNLSIMQENILKSFDSTSFSCELHTMKLIDEYNKILSN